MFLLWITDGVPEATGNYTSNLDHHTYAETCTSPDWKAEMLVKRNTGHVCKHLFATTIFEARNCRPTNTSGPKIIRHQVSRTSSNLQYPGIALCPCGL